jgi:hypothetical protein
MNIRECVVYYVIGSKPPLHEDEFSELTPMLGKILTGYPFGAERLTCVFTILGRMMKAVHRARPLGRNWMRVENPASAFRRGMTAGLVAAPLNGMEVNVFPHCGLS